MTTTLRRKIRQFSFNVSEYLYPFDFNLFGSITPSEKEPDNCTEPSTNGVTR